jgi:hypothetical protein
MSGSEKLRPFSETLFLLPSQKAQPSFAASHSGRKNVCTYCEEKS